MKRLTLLLCSCLLLSVSAASADERLDRVLGEIKEASGTVESLATDFVQEKSLSIFEETVTSKGRLLFAQPDTLRWELTEPVASGFAIRGTKGKRWHERSGKPQTFNIEKEPGMKVIVDQLMAWARVDLDWLSKKYRMTLTAENPVVMTLVPLSDSVGNVLDHITISFSADKKRVDKVEFYEKGGDSTRILFSGARINTPLDMEEF